MLYHTVAAIIIAVLLGEAIKLIVQKAAHVPLRPFHYGGMLSTHSAAIAALCTGVLAETGISLLFVACVVFSTIVALDAYNVRWEVTKHSFALNERFKTKEFEIAGHTRPQVLAGLCLGILVTILVYMLL
ncbi:TPA: divergent PAP2 family protein [Candidatus Woesearchaeota archaeon]|nr:divergent PAP2 family protein [Candidatus Woesearchaeota archaeon]